MRLRSSAPDFLAAFKVAGFLPAGWTFEGVWSGFGVGVGVDDLLRDFDSLGDSDLAPESQGVNNGTSDPSMRRKVSFWVDASCTEAF